VTRRDLAVTTFSGILVGVGVASSAIFVAGGPVWAYVVGCVTAIVGLILGIVWHVRSERRRLARLRGELR
jgi:membrane associated rhomboid family serine protease